MSGNQTGTSVAPINRRTFLVAAAGGAALAAGIAETALPAATVSADDALTAARFELSIDGHSMAVFSELAGISSAVDVVDYIQSSKQEIIFKNLPAKRLPPTVTLKRGLTNNMDMQVWQDEALSDTAGRKSCSLVMYDTAGTPVAKYAMTQAWPSKVEIGSTPSGTSWLLTETVTLVCAKLVRQDPRR